VPGNYKTLHVRFSRFGTGEPARNATVNYHVDDDVFTFGAKCTKNVQTRGPILEMLVVLF